MLTLLTRIIFVELNVEHFKQTLPPRIVSRVPVITFYKSDKSLSLTLDATVMNICSVSVNDTDLPMLHANVLERVSFECWFIRRYICVISVLYLCYICHFTSTQIHSVNVDLLDFEQCLHFSIFLSYV